MSGWPLRTWCSLPIPLAAIVLTSAVAPASQEPSSPVEVQDDPVTYLRAALDIVQARALKRDAVEWDVQRPTWEARAAEVTSIEETYPILQDVLRALGDGHSFFLDPDAVRVWRGEETSREEATPAEGETESARQARDVFASDVAWPTITGRIIDDEVAYVCVPECGSGNSVLLEAYATTLFEWFRRLNDEEPLGWVIDLRGNTGGNCWPMLAGCSALLGDGVVGAFATVDEFTYYGVSSGKAWATVPVPVNATAEVRDRAERTELQTTKCAPLDLHDPEPWIAVLTDERTASSGEVMTVAFREHPRTRSFGHPSAGLSTANAGIDLADGAMIFLTTSVYADRTGRWYGEEIVPDEPVDLDEPPSEHDAVLERAVTWVIESWSEGSPLPGSQP